MVLAGGLASGLFTVVLVGIDLVEEPATVLVLGLVMPVLGTAFAGAFWHMGVRDGGDRVVVWFGPLPLVRAEVPYQRMESVRLTEVKRLERWQVREGHPAQVYAARRGAAVEIFLKKEPGQRLRRSVVLGTDDASNLIAFLEAKLRETRAAKRTHPPIPLVGGKQP